ncbi:prolyl oligopeptidase family serine peptidase [Neptunicella sp. SCSIO 80796]|uniref:S9 family peptidase n=1 Tax=Neptunicella plasticusilytica TaxID=3117012 RepID=UPI003A4DECDF
MHKTRQLLLVTMVSTSLLSCSSTSQQTQSVVEQVREPVKTIKAPQMVSPSDGQITLEQIMADPDWLGRQPEQAYWSDNSEGIYYLRKRQGQPIEDLWHKSLNQQGNGELVPLTTMHQQAYDARVVSADGKHSAWQFEGNLFIKDLPGGQVRQLSKGNIDAQNLAFMLDGRLSYQSDDQIFALDPVNGLVELLAAWEFKDKPQALDKPADYIAEQQQKLIQVIADKRADRQAYFDYQRQLQQQNSSLTSDPFYLPKDLETVEASLSPNGKWLLLAVEAERQAADEGDIMPSYVNEDGRIKALPARQRVADAKPLNHQLWLLDLQQHSAKELSYSALPGYNEDVLASVKQENAKRKGQTYQINRLPRDIALLADWYWDGSAIQWQASGNQVAVMLEAWDNKDRWLATVDLNNKTLVSQERLHDDAWINYRFNSFGWLNNSATLYYLSEKSGYANLYTQVPGQEAKALVQGNFEVDNLSLTNDDQFIYYQANTSHPGIYEVYRVSLQTGQSEKLTDLGGMTEYQLSPDESKLLLTHSKLSLPPELYLQNARPGAKVNRLTHTVSDAFMALPWTVPDIVPVPSSHTSQPIYARVYYPQDVKQGQPKKAVMFTHGAGYLQNSHLGWSGYFHEFMFHSLLAQQGYVVMDMDYRASRGYGRDWRTAIYRHMGKPEVEDMRDGVNWLVDNANVDRQRIGTYGGSYGGFMTYMSLFTQPDLFQAGAALRPVSDWAHYNHGYTSNILNMPDVDPIAYERSSPIYFAEGLQKPLLINAPMVDSNVFFVDTVRLVQRLIELHKDNFETALFPVESHGFVQPSSWLDEYKRIYKLFEREL